MTNVAAHKKLRSTITEAFSYSNIKSFFPVFINILSSFPNSLSIIFDSCPNKSKILMDKWNDNIKEGENKVDILTDFDLLALDIIGRVAFASDFNALQKNKKYIFLLL